MTYYALSDWTTGDYPREYSAGFGNTKVVIGFTTRAQRDEWVHETKLTTARALTRRDAMAWGDKWRKPLRDYDCTDHELIRCITWYGFDGQPSDYIGV